MTITASGNTQIQLQTFPRKKKSQPSPVDPAPLAKRRPGKRLTSK